MLEPIIMGMVQWMYDLMISLTKYAIWELLGVMNMDLAYFERTAPIIGDIVTVITALGWALLIGNLVFQCIKSMMSGIGFEAEDPKITFCRTFVFAFLLLSSRQICNMCSKIAGITVKFLSMPTWIQVQMPDESMFTVGDDAKWLLVIIVGVTLAVQIIKLLFEIGERYVITSVLTFFAPLAFAMGGSKNTNDIFKGWCRMYGSMLLMMILNIIFLKLIMSAMSQMIAGGVLIWLVFIVALARVARKIDAHIGKLGLNPAQTGDGIGSRLPGVLTMVAIRTMSSLVSRSMAHAKGGSGGKGSQGGRGRGDRNGMSGHDRKPNSPIHGPSRGAGGRDAKGAAPVMAGTTFASALYGSGNNYTNHGKPQTQMGTEKRSTMTGERIMDSTQQETGKLSYTPMGGTKERSRGIKSRPPISRNTAGSYPSVQGMPSTSAEEINAQGKPESYVNGAERVSVSGGSSHISRASVSSAVKGTDRFKKKATDAAGKDVSEVVYAHSDTVHTTPRMKPSTGATVKSTGEVQSEQEHLSHTYHRGTRRQYDFKQFSQQIQRDQEHRKSNPASANKKGKNMYYQKRNSAKRSK